MRTQLANWLIYRKPGVIGSQLEQDPTRLAKIYGVEIIAVDLWRDMQPPAEYLLAKGHLHLFISHPECHMVIGAATIEPSSLLWRFYQVDDRGRKDGIRPEPVPVPLLAFLPVSEYIRQDRSRRHNVPQRQRDAMEPFHPGRHRNLGRTPRLPVIRIIRRDK